MDRPQQRRRIKHERRVEDGGKANQHWQGTRFRGGERSELEWLCRSVQKTKFTKFKFQKKKEKKGKAKKNRKKEKTQKKRKKKGGT